MRDHGRHCALSLDRAGRQDITLCGTVAGHLGLGETRWGGERPHFLTGRETGPCSSFEGILRSTSAYHYFALAAWIQGRVEAPLPMFEALMAQHLSGAGVPSA